MSPELGNRRGAARPTIAPSLRTLQATFWAAPTAKPKAEGKCDCLGKHAGVNEDTKADAQRRMAGTSRCSHMTLGSLSSRVMQNVSHPVA